MTSTPCAARTRACSVSGPACGGRLAGQRGGAFLGLRGERTRRSRGLAGQRGGAFLGLCGDLAGV